MNGPAGEGIALEKRMRIDFTYGNIWDGHKNILFDAGVYTNMLNQTLILKTDLS